MTNEDLIDAAELGEEAKRFLESDLGKSLLARAEQETTAAMEAMLTVDASDTRAIAALQNRAAMGRQFPQWIAEIMDIGKNAVDVWRQQNTDGDSN